MTRFFGRSVALAFLAIGISLSLTIATALIVIQLLGGQVFVDRMACQFGFSDDCIRLELEEERRKLQDLRQRNKELEALYERLRRLDHASESFVVFYTDYEGEQTVTSAHRYASLIDPGTLIGGWCYIHLPSPTGTSKSFFVAHMDRDAVVAPDAITDEALERSGLTQQDVTAAYGRCRWPGS